LQPKFKTEGLSYEKNDRLKRTKTS
jgi:hypothetical protein